MRQTAFFFRKDSMEQIKQAAAHAQKTQPLPERRTIRLPAARSSYGTGYSFEEVRQHRVRISMSLSTF